MKFKKTIILFMVFAVLLAAVLLFESKGQKNKAKKETEAKFVDFTSADIQKITLNNDTGSMTFEKDVDGVWQIKEPMVVQADDIEVGDLAGSIAGLKIERVVEAEPKDLETYEIPKRDITVWLKDRNLPVKILIGTENPIDYTLFAKREDENRVVLLPASLKTSLDKKLFDFRAKDIFKFETRDVQAIKIRAGDIAWAAAKQDDTWELTSPIEAMANGNQLDNLLWTLSGLKAKEFISENKSDEDIKKYGLDKPEYEVNLSMPTVNKEAVISLHKSDDSVYAAGSLSDKIVMIEATALADLEKKADEYREKKPAVFNSWEADRISVTKGDVTVAAIKETLNNEEKWRIDASDKPEADGSKVDTLIRKIESLEAAEFIDTPKDLAEYGLDKPVTKLVIRVKESESQPREITLLVGKEDSEKKQVVLKNSDLKYLFRLDSAFLVDIPKDVMDWKAEVKSEADADKIKGKT